MRTFILYRTEDVSGVSGIGVVAEGVQFSDGVCVCRWRPDSDTASTCVYDSIADVTTIHGHDGGTQIIWEDTLVTPSYTAQSQSSSASPY